MAHAIAKHVAQRGVHVVSGGALGIDGAAHRGAMDGGGTTTVVLGCGVDIAYPARHRELFRRIVERGGALVSIFPDGTPPFRPNFPRRNAVIAELVQTVIVVEAAVQSGSLSTAHAAKRKDRALAACPGTPGCDRLIAAGCAVIESMDDVDALLAGCPRRGLEQAPLDPVTARVVAAMERGARGIDAIVMETQLSVREVLRALNAISERKPS